MNWNSNPGGRKMSDDRQILPISIRQIFLLRQIQDAGFNQGWQHEGHKYQQNQEDKISNSWVHDI
jgi:hypothetical protein